MGYGRQHHHRNQRSNVVVHHSRPKPVVVHHSRPRPVVVHHSARPAPVVVHHHGRRHRHRRNNVPVTDVECVCAIM